MSRYEKLLWSVVAGASAGILWHRNGKPLPFAVKKQIGFRQRRREEKSQLEFLAALCNYEAANPGAISPEVLEDAEAEFGETMLDNDVMGVWNRVFRRPHPFHPIWDAFLPPETVEGEDE